MARTSKKRSKADKDVQSVTYRVPGSTTNLGSGFDTLGIALQVYNTFTMSVIPEGTEIEATGMGADSIMKEKENMVVRAALAALEYKKTTLPGLKVKIEARIPLARGMGSSSTAILAGVLGADALTGPSLTETEVLTIAGDLEGHFDNLSACFQGGMTVCYRDKDGMVHARSHNFPKGLKVAVLVPELIVFTKKARELLPEKVDFWDAVFNLNRLSLLMSCLLTGDFEHLKVAVEDRLHQPFRTPLNPYFEEVAERAYNAGAKAVFMGGAGPSVVAFYTDNAEAVAQALMSYFDELGIVSRVLFTEVDDMGAQRLY